METPKAYREAGVTYFVPPFTDQEQVYVDGHKLVPVASKWKHVPTGDEGVHIVYLFPEDVKRFPLLLDHWNRTEQWRYSLTNATPVVF